MATIYPSDPLAMPTTPVKGDLTEPTPDYTTPAPQYTQEAGSAEVEMLGSKKHRPHHPHHPQKGYHGFLPEKPVTILPVNPPVTTLPVHPPTGHDTLHPVYPRGDIFHDIRNHLRCHTLFNSNIETLLSQFSTMKLDLEKAHIELATKRREFERERSEKESYRRQFETLKITLTETQSDLREARTDLAETQTKLGLSITQLAEVAQRLESAKSDLRSVIRERDELNIRLSDKEKEIRYYMSRTAELQLSLEAAIKAEGDANERNSRLTQILLEIERKMVSIEQAKIIAEMTIRELKETIQRLQTELDSGEGRALIDELRAQHTRLDWEVVQLKDQLVRERNRLVDRDNHIEHQDRKLAVLNGRVSTFWERIQDYDNIVQTLHHAESRRKFPHMYRRTMLDGGEMPEFSFDDVHILSEEKPSEGITSSSTDATYNANTVEHPSHEHEHERATTSNGAATPPVTE